MHRKIFELKDVNYTRLGKFPAICNVSFDLFERERVSFIGANGSGKSTLLHILDGLAFPQEGEIKFLGQGLSEESFKDGEFKSFFRKKVGFVFQNSDIQLFSTTVRDEIAFGPMQLGLPQEDVEKRVNDLLAMLNIENLSDRAPYHLSGGEKKRVAIASTLAVNPDILLLDEPTNGLDPRSQTWLVELLEVLSRAGKTIVTATHDLNIVQRISDRVIVLSEDHTLIADGKTSEVLSNSSLLLKVNLIHEHSHRHGNILHNHPHSHLRDHEHAHDAQDGHAHDAPDEHAGLSISIETEFK